MARSTLFPNANLGRSLFDKCTLMLNGHEVDSVAHYAHHAYLQNLLDTSTNEKKTVMGSAGWWENRMFGRYIAHYTANQITARRRAFTNNSPQIDLNSI